MTDKDKDLIAINVMGWNRDKRPSYWSKDGIEIVGYHFWNPDYNASDSESLLQELANIGMETYLMFYLSIEYRTDGTYGWACKLWRWTDYDLHVVFGSFVEGTTSSSRYQSIVECARLLAEHRVRFLNGKETI